MKVQSTAVKDDLHKRLRRIEGQVRGIQKMLDDDRECHEIVQQLSAVRAAVQNAAQLFMRSYAKECLLHIDETDGRDREALVDDLVNLMTKAG